MWPRLPVPVVARIHGSASYFASELNRRLTLHDFWIERASLRRADFLCAISGYAAERTRQVFSLGDRPITVLHDFVDAEAFSSHPAAVRSRSTVVYSGTLTAKKGVVELFDAWQQVVTRNRDARLHVYGKDSRNSDGRSMKEYLESRLEPAIRQTVQFHGHTPRHVLFAALAQARVGVFPSYSETFGLGPVESMAAGCPTIYGRCGCAEEIVNDRIDGILVNPREPQQIADAIVSVISDDQLAQRLGDGGRLRVQQQFTREIMLHRNEEFYRRSLAQYASRTATAPADSVSGAAIVEVARSRPELGNTAQVPVPEVVVLPLGIGNGGVSQPQ
jgi:glycosyltransferase involved in cell wall biosynthesis